MFLIAGGTALVSATSSAHAHGDTQILSNLSLLFPLLVTALAELAAPMALPALATIWCIALPQRGTTQLLAARGARHRLTASTTVETPVMVAGALVAGYYALFALLERYWYANRLPVGSGFAIDTWMAFALFAGPVLICSVGAAAGMVMCARSRGRDVMTLVSLGATPCRCLAVAAVEALIHTVDAAFAALVISLTSNLLLAATFRLSLGDAFAALRLPPLVAVAVAGFVLVLATQLITTLIALRGEPVSRSE